MPSTKPAPSPTPNRFLAAFLAAGCLIAGAVFGLLEGFDSVWAGTFIRTGLVLGPLWLVLPKRGESGFWTKITWVHWVVGMAALWVIVRRPIILAPLFLGLFLLSAFTWGPPARKS